jgi:uncharacterized protein (TIGR02099 family)
LDQPLQRLEQAIEETIAHAIPPRSRWRVAARIAGWALVAAYFLFAAAVLSLRYWILPKGAEYKGDIERFASKALGQRITIGALETGWQGLRPELFLANVTIYDHDGRAALSLPTIEATLAWTSVLFVTPRFYSLVFDRPRLEIRRDEASRIYVAGIELHPERKGDAGIAQWVLAQREIAIHDASVSWDDKLRGAPLLELPALNFVLRNGFLGHRFAFRAKPPAELASALDVRGELHGGDVGDLSSWSGQLFAELEYTDLVAWRRWVDYPLEIRSGRGGVRLWLSLGGKNSTEATADVALSQVVMRVTKDLPLLELDYLRGQLGARQREGKTFEAFGRRVSLRTGAGVALAPADFRVLWQPEDGRTPQKGEVEANALELAQLAKLAEYLPLPEHARARLAATDPRGTVHDLKLSWSGDAENPQHYSLRGGFSDLAARAYERIPGFTGLSGRLDASEQGGNLALASEKVTIDLPGIVAEGRAQFDAIVAQISWKLAPDQFELGFSNLSFANRDVAGTLFGSFATQKGSPGIIDLTGEFTRADGPAVYRYIPWLPEPVREYLKASILSGYSNDVRLRLKGNLAKFPFDDPKTGIFRVVAKVNDVQYRFAEGWPQASGVTGDLIFQGRSMRVLASKAGIVEVQSNNVQAEIPDLYRGDERVKIDIHAEDQTGDFLKFVSQSPVTGFLDGFTDGMRSTGAGRLALQLEIPIRHLDQVKVAGDYQFTDNHVQLNADAPPFSRVNGRLEFSETGIIAPSITAQFLGGPTTISIVTRDDGVIVASARGLANVGQLPRAWGGPLLRRASGSATWQATLTSVRRQSVTLVVESRLTGIAADLPPPLGKSAAESLPLRIERVTDIAPASERRDETIKLSLGRSVNAQLLRRRERGQYVVARGVISLNEPAVLPDREGIAVTGRLPYADVDRWRALLGGDRDGDSGSTSTSVNLKIAALDFIGRRINHVSLRAASSGGDWIANVVAKELAGEIAWRPEGHGRVVARLRQFTIPEPAPETPASNRLSGDMPSLDIVAENLILRDSNLGKLELLAINQAGDWRIEKLVLTGPESTLAADGVWQNWAVRPSVSVNVKLEVEDTGKYLDRMGYPRTMQRGKATLEGKIGWMGNPQSIDYSTLSGNLALRAEKGQFLKAEPSAAKLLGVLSLQSWVTLDFRELGRGFAFDSISSNATIAQGVLSTQDFRIQAPSAQVAMSGEVDLVRETQNLQVRVVPSVGGSLSSLAIILVNPAWGLGSLLVQKILKDPLGQIFAFEYHVTGSWTQPQVERLKAEVRKADIAQPSSQ